MTGKKFGDEGRPTKKKGIEANLGQKDAQIDKEKDADLAGMGRKSSGEKDKRQIQRWSGAFAEKALNSAL